MAEGGGPPTHRGWMRLLMDADGPDTEYVAEPDTSVSDIAILVRVAPRTDTAARPTV
jgi:hypothetical protein